MQNASLFSNELLAIVLVNTCQLFQLLESKIQEAKSKKDTLKARAQSAKSALFFFFLSYTEIYFIVNSRE